VDKYKESSPAGLQRIKALEITLAYSEYKTRYAGDLDSELVNWSNNIIRFIELERLKLGN